LLFDTSEKKDVTTEVENDKMHHKELFIYCTFRNVSTLSQN